MSGFAQRIEKVRSLLGEKSLDSIVLRRNPNLAWAIGGRVHVPLTLDLACFDLIVSAEKVIAITNKVEGPRLISEELPAGIEVIQINWWDGRDSHLPAGEKVGCDQPGGNRVDLSKEIELLRQSLVAEDVERLKAISVDAAVALGNALKEALPTDREIDVTARISSALWKSDLELVFIGVAGQSRVRKFRHPLPTSEIVGNRIVASICARRKGLIASVTRIVSFAGDQRDGYENILKVESDIFEKTVVGLPFSAPVEAAVSAYKKYGFDKDEWQKHHQGGPTGYLPRDWPANLNSSQEILPNQAIAWNPTGNGWKAEDTVLATASGLEILSNDPTWPELSIAGRIRPGLLIK
jgi:Xaa-Pro dipeptidase